MEEIVLNKLGLQQRGAYNILNNKELCNRIVNENPIWIDDFVLKYVVSKHTIQGLINRKMISSFSNTENKGSKIFIFENEALEYFKLDYNPSTIYRNAKHIVELYLLRVKDSLTSREHEIITDILINNIPYDDMVEKYDLTKERVRQIYEKANRRIRLEHRISANYEKALAEYNALKFDVELLKNKKKELNQYLSNKDSKVLDKKYENLNLEL